MLNEIMAGKAWGTKPPEVETMNVERPRDVSPLDKSNMDHVFKTKLNALDKNSLNHMNAKLKPMKMPTMPNMKMPGMKMPGMKMPNMKMPSLNTPHTKNLLGGNSKINKSNKKINTMLKQAKSVEVPGVDMPMGKFFNTHKDFKNIQGMKVNKKVSNYLGQSKGKTSNNLEALAMKRMNQQKMLNMWGDRDKDGVPNVLDCWPFNKKRQGPENNMEEGKDLVVTSSTDVEEFVPPQVIDVPEPDDRGTPYAEPIDITPRVTEVEAELVDERVEDITGSNIMQPMPELETYDATPQQEKTKTEELFDEVLKESGLTEEDIIRSQEEEERKKQEEKLSPEQQKIRSTLETQSFEMKEKERLGLVKPEKQEKSNNGKNIVPEEDEQDAARWRGELKAYEKIVYETNLQRAGLGKKGKKGKKSKPPGTDFMEGIATTKGLKDATKNIQQSLGSPTGKGALQAAQTAGTSGRGISEATTPLTSTGQGATQMTQFGGQGFQQMTPGTGGGFTAMSTVAPAGQGVYEAIQGVSDRPTPIDQLFARRGNKVSEALGTQREEEISPEAQQGLMEEAIERERLKNLMLQQQIEREKLMQERSRPQQQPVVAQQVTQQQASPQSHETQIMSPYSKRPVSYTRGPYKKN